MFLAISVEGHPIDHFYHFFFNSDHQFHRRSLKFCYRDKPRPLAAMFLTDQISFSLFGRGSPTKHSCEVWSKLDQRFKSCHLKEIVDDARRRRTLTYPNNSLCASEYMQAGYCIQLM